MLIFNFCQIKEKRDFTGCENRQQSKVTSTQFTHPTPLLPTLFTPLCMIGADISRERASGWGEGRVWGYQHQGHCFWATSIQGHLAYDTYRGTVCPKWHLGEINVPAPYTLTCARKMGKRRARTEPIELKVGTREQRYVKKCSATLTAWLNELFYISEKGVGKQLHMLSSVCLM